MEDETIIEQLLNASVSGKNLKITGSLQGEEKERIVFLKAGAGFSRIGKSVCGWEANNPGLRFEISSCFIDSISLV
jgi:hypothetical protein